MTPAEMIARIEANGNALNAAARLLLTMTTQSRSGETVGTEQAVRAARQVLRDAVDRWDKRLWRASGWQAQVAEYTTPEGEWEAQARAEAVDVLADSIVAAGSHLPGSTVDAGTGLDVVGCGFHTTRTHVGTHRWSSRGAEYLCPGYVTAPDPGSKRPSEIMAAKADEAQKRADAIVNVHLEHPAHDLALVEAYTYCANLAAEHEREAEADRVEAAGVLARLKATSDAYNTWRRPDERPAAEEQRRTYDEHPSPMEPH